MKSKIKDIPVEEYTSPDPVTVGPDAGFDEIFSLMKDQGFRHLPVVEHSKAVGIISDRDVLLAQSKEGGKRFTARQIMTANPYSVTRKTSLQEVVFELSSRKFGSAIVTNADGRLYGIFTATDGLNALVEVLRGEILK